MSYPQTKTFVLLIFCTQLIHPVNLNLSDDSTANRIKVMRTFAPELRLDSKEEFFPSSVQWFWNHASFRFFVDQKPEMLI